MTTQNSTVENNVFSRDLNSQQEFRPLMIGCSGGGGHISAIQGIHSYFEDRYNKDGVNYVSKDHAPKQYDDMQQHYNEDPTRQKIEQGFKILHDLSFISTSVRWLLNKIPLFPVIPSRNEVDIEINKLKEKNSPNQTRKYVDMLLDIYPAGYESAAIWNVLQRNDKTNMLSNLIKAQKSSDSANHKIVKEAYLRMLNDAEKSGEPYTELVSTQAMALPALCDAVNEYNSPRNNTSRVVIHQYMTDLPTKGADHYFNALQSLSNEQQAVISWRRFIRYGTNGHGA